jgi:hypothetical protein
MSLIGLKGKFGGDQGVWELVILLAVLGIWAFIIFRPAHQGYMSVNPAISSHETMASKVWNSISPYIDSRIEETVRPYLKELILTEAGMANVEPIVEKDNALASMLDNEKLDIRTRIALAFWLFQAHSRDVEISQRVVTIERLQALTEEALKAPDLETMWLYALALLMLDWDDETPSGGLAAGENLTEAAKLLSLATQREPDNGWYEMTMAEAYNHSLGGRQFSVLTASRHDKEIAEKSVELIISASHKASTKVPPLPPFQASFNARGSLGSIRNDLARKWFIDTDEKKIFDRMTSAEDMNSRYRLTLLGAEMLSESKAAGRANTKSADAAAYAGNELLKKQVADYLELSAPPPSQIDNDLQVSSGGMVTEAQLWWQDEVELSFYDLIDSEDLFKNASLAREIFRAMTSPPKISPREAGEKLQVYWRELTQGEPEYNLYMEYLGLLSEYLDLLGKQHPTWATPRFWRLHQMLKAEVTAVQKESPSHKTTWFNDSVQKQRTEYEFRRLKDLKTLTKDRPKFIAEMRGVANWLRGHKGQEEKADALEKLAAQFSDPPSKTDPDAMKVVDLLSVMAKNNLYPAVEGYFEGTRPVMNMAAKVAEYSGKYRTTWIPLSGDMYSTECRSSENTMRLRPLLAKIFLEAYNTAKQQRREESKHKAPAKGRELE